MINSIVSFLKNKKILILGFGREGKSSLNFINNYLPNADVTIADKNNIDVPSTANVSIITGDNYLNTLNSFDIILKSPGISLKDVIVDKSKISSQLDLFLKFSTIKTVGITGTKGKTTTSTLIYNILSSHTKKCFLLGNIGVPVFECLPSITPESIAVIEISSHQLEFMTHSPNISIITNFYQEHLDHYLSYEHYINAKLNIFKYQKKSDWCIFNIDQHEYLSKILDNTCSNICKISLDDTNNSNFFLDSNLVITQFNNNTTSKYFCVKNLNNNLIGKHHFYDILFAFAVCNILGINSYEIESILRQFKGIPHRMEYIGKYKDILFYNDSIATIPAAVINAVNSLKKVDTLIIGGMDRGIDYADFIEFLANSNIGNIICLYETGEKIAKILNTNYSNITPKIYVASDLDEATTLAFLHTKKEHICLLSPAAASYGYFKNFEERGNTFKKYVFEKGK